ncbi:ribonuclease VapC43 [Agromyces luteolus]|uniref:Ribonuclease VapC n=1 Tax=Agromyces luteolus TaxID=88373 RepID=A0A7C9LVS3_9MICO|nr:type II toxin-antitoxin system VapC family toxin [Agromyces luteolus]MUN05857.1 PIN domain-containing protein [Agromyces luteolus]GLK26409.1 ribonuclease VapC43 [Agromyces luteolus]
MLIPDVNVLVGAHRTDAPDHERLRAWLESAATGREALGLTDAVLAGFVRVVTHPRVFVDPTPLEIALGQAEALREAPGIHRVSPGARHWQILVDLCRTGSARGNLVPDAAHAATAIEAGATWISLDRDFARFPGLRWRSPLD